ncbi:Gx transporter family protein [Aerococcaceae bacterium zg-ZUI334]|uniref:Gx transporter family protein n=1 Tax=Aerococcaceae bacterium zg-252 TaxID=2796928 RepID=UPI001B9E3EE2|nr:Gx transporter family protein [Aerococcaceae bacterium zg-ZUI334]MBS4462593.1 Gx transporter family protein [Aerococcaceae bacterium zg-B36]
MKRGRYQLLVYLAMLAAQGVVISLLERFIPSPFAFAPGAKLGLANLVTIIAIFTLPKKYSLQVVALRLVLATLLGGTLSTFLYSAAGGLLSYLVMILLQYLGPKRVSIVGISVMGGMAHNLGQLSMAALLAKSWAVLNYLPVLSVSGILAGFAVGFVGNLLLHKISVLRVYHDELIKSRAQESWLSLM